LSPGSDEPTVQAHAIMERVLALVRECRLVLGLEHAGKAGESPSAEAERILYYGLRSAIDAGVIRTMEDALGSYGTRASRLGRWAEWLQRQARALGKGGE